MNSNWKQVIDENRLYRPKELGGKGNNSGLLNMSYDSVIRKIVNRYEGIIAVENEDGTYRSPILIPGWVVLKWIEDCLEKSRLRLRRPKEKKRPFLY